MWGTHFILLSNFFYLIPYRIATLLSNSSLQLGSIELIIFTSIRHKTYFWRELNVQWPGSFIPFINRWCSQIFAFFLFLNKFNLLFGEQNATPDIWEELKKLKLKQKTKWCSYGYYDVWCSMLDCTWIIRCIK